MSELIQHLLSLLRAESDPIKQSEYIVKLRRQGVANVEIAKLMQKSPAQVSHIARINRLPEIIIDAYYSRMLSLTHLYIISRLHHEGQMQIVFEQIMAGTLSTQETDRLVREKLHSIDDVGDYVNRDTLKMHNEYMNAHGLQVSVLQTRTRFKYTIEASGNAEKTSALLQGIMRVMQQFEPQEGGSAEKTHALQTDSPEDL